MLIEAIVRAIPAPARLEASAALDMHGGPRSKKLSTLMQPQLDRLRSPARINDGDCNHRDEIQQTSAVISRLHFGKQPESRLWMPSSDSSSWSKCLLLCASRIRLPLALKFLFAATIIIWGCIYMYIRGQNDNNFFYVVAQCFWKSYGSLEQYSKSGHEYPCVSSILQQSTNHGGFFDASFPTDKVLGIRALLNPKPVCFVCDMGRHLLRLLVRWVNVVVDFTYSVHSS
jgi:hypothetical protein